MALPELATAYLTLAENGDALLVGFKRRMLNDEENIEQLGQELFSLVEQHNRLKIALDMSRVDYLTSSVIGKMITLHRKLHRQKGQMVLFGLSEGVSSILRTSKLLSYFVVVSDANSAVALLAQT